MQVTILNESGYEEALLGMSLSFYAGKEELFKWWEKQKPKAIKRSAKLAHMQGGHNKFVEHIELWIMVTAPLSFWKHADTYRMSSKQSSSTMHTLKKRLPLDRRSFSEDTHPALINAFNTVAASEKDMRKLADNLPDGFLQERIWKMSYKTLQNILNQREGHRLKHWEDFRNQILQQVEHPELLLKD